MRKNIIADYLLDNPVQVIPDGEDRLKVTVIAFSNNSVALAITHNADDSEKDVFSSGSDAPVLPNPAAPNEYVKWHLLSSDVFKAIIRNIFKAYDFEFQLSPESVAAGATLEDMTLATETDIANFEGVLSLRKLLP